MDRRVATGVRRFGSFELDLEAERLLKNGRTIRIQPQPFRLLCLLTNHPGVLVTREEIQAALWAGDTFVDFDQGVNFAVKQVRDYERKTLTLPGSQPQPLAGPKGDLVFLDLATEGNYVACRPSGTEPKIKFYMFTFTPPEMLSNLDLAKEQLERRLDSMEADLRKFAGV